MKKLFLRLAIIAVTIGFVGCAEPSVEGDWEDKNEFTKALPNGTVLTQVTDGETTFEDDGDWKSSGKLTITINGEEFRFRQKSSGTWEKKDNELEIITDDGTPLCLI